jgi:hypothetical protein
VHTARAQHIIRGGAAGLKGFEGRALSTTSTSLLSSRACFRCADRRRAAPCLASQAAGEAGEAGTRHVPTWRTEEQVVLGPLADFILARWREEAR